MSTDIFGISRHRMGTDGKGITTLVAFMGCPLHCRYCLNPQCHAAIHNTNGQHPRTGILRLTPEALYRKVSLDDLYFQATGGGICFGGGEPALQSAFIRRFADLCGKRWRITMETSLHAPVTLWTGLCDIVDEWIVDVKDMNPLIYKEYTGTESKIREHLALLLQRVPAERIMVKVPHIPGFNTEADVQASIVRLREMGFSRIHGFHYITTTNANTSLP